MSERAVERKGILQGLASLFAIERADEAASEPNMPAEGGMSGLALVGRHCQQFGIEPVPEHYALLYRHLVKREPGLGPTVDHLIRYGTIPLEAHEPEADEELSEAIAATASATEETIAETQDLLRQSGSHAGRFRSALADGAEDLRTGDDAASVIRALIEATQSIIAQASVTEQALRARGNTIAKLKQSLAEANATAQTDALTGLSNRRCFERMLGAAAERSRSSGRPLALAFCDIDHFKLINDTHGHDAGDRVLRFVGGILGETFAPHGTVFRHGGEEFVVLVEDFDAREALELVEHAREDLAARSIVDKATGRPIGHVTFSAGIAAFDPACDVSEMLFRADKALYAAKHAGRNCSRVGN